MSAVIETPQSRVNLPNVQKRETVQRDLHSPHAIRWGWNPFVTIKTEFERCGYTELPPRELLGFTDIEYPIRDPRDAGGVPPVGAETHSVNTFGSGAGRPLIALVPKDARTIAEDISAAYSEYGFTILHSLTGIDPDPAFLIYNTVTGGYIWDLADWQDALDDAQERIDGSDLHKERVEEPYYNEDNKRATRIVTYAQIAERVQRELQGGLNRALAKRDEVIETTERSMGERRGGSNTGKIAPDALDRELYKQSHIPLPSNIRAPQATPQGDEETKQLIRMMAENMINTQQAGNMDEAKRMIEELRAITQQQQKQIAALAAGRKKRR